MEIEYSSGRVTVRTTQARVGQAAAQRAIDRVVGMAATEAVTTLSFSAGTVCEPVARVIEAALAHATRNLHFPAAMCIVERGEVGDGERVVRVRRQAHGLATWITTETTSIAIELSVPTLQSISGVSA